MATPDPKQGPINVDFTPDNPAYEVRYNNHIVPQQLYDTAKWASQTYLVYETGGQQIPTELLLAICWRESEFHNGQSRIVPPQQFSYLAWDNGYEDSWGPLQLLRRPYGLGGSYTPEQLLDVRLNLALGTYHIAREVGRGLTLYEAVAGWSSRPYFWPEYINGNPVSINWKFY